MSGRGLEALGRPAAVDITPAWSTTLFMKSRLVQSHSPVIENPPRAHLTLATAPDPVKARECGSSLGDETLAQV